MTIILSILEKLNRLSSLFTKDKLVTVWLIQLKIFIIIGWQYAI